METVDDETSAAAIDFIDRQVQADTPFFVWMNTTRMHARTHVRPEHRSAPGLTALTEYADGMIETDAVVGTILDKIDELGIADNTIVIYTTDNGPHQNTWPDAGTTPFRCEKNTNWEGAFRVPRRGPLARPHRARHRVQRHLLRPRLVPDAARRRRRHRTSTSSCSTARRSTARSTRTTSTATTSSTT